MLLVSRLAVRYRLGATRTIWIDPTKVRFHVGTNEPATQHLKEKIGRAQRRFPVLKAPLSVVRQFVNQSDSWVIHREAYPQPEPIELEPRYALIADFIEHLGRPSASLWYRQLLMRLEATGLARHKQIVMRSRDDLDVFFKDYVVPMIVSLEKIRI